jgi:hypothetical protein
VPLLVRIRRVLGRLARRCPVRAVWTGVCEARVDIAPGESRGISLQASDLRVRDVVQAPGHLGARHRSVLAVVPQHSCRALLDANNGPEAYDDDEGDDRYSQGGLPRKLDIAYQATVRRVTSGSYDRDDDHRGPGSVSGSLLEIPEQLVGEYECGRLRRARSRTQQGRGDSPSARWGRRGGRGGPLRGHR